jgi:hypothetical protein
MKARSRHAPTVSASGDSTFNALVEEIVDRLLAGEAVDFDDYRLHHPEQADKLDDLIPAMRLMADLGQSVQPESVGEMAGVC